MSSAFQCVRCTRMLRVARARVVAPVLLGVVLLLVGAHTAQSQSTTGLDTLDLLIAEALERSPAIEVARHRVSAARARVKPAGARADPNLMAALVAIPIVKPSLTDDDFTMLMVGVQQSFPYPGKRALRSRVATLEADALGSAIDGARRGVVRVVKELWFEIAYLDHALEIAERSRVLLADVVRLTESQYGSGTGTQQDVLKARVEAARLTETVTALTEARVASLAALNATLDRPTDSPLSHATIPARLARASVATDAASIRFTSLSIGARAADSPLPALHDLQDLAVRSSPALRELETRLAAQGAQVDLARREYKPDFDVSLQYNHRVAFPDLLTAQVSIPLRLQKSSRQDQAVAEATADRSALEAERRAEVRAVRAGVATLVSEIELNRTQLALYVKAILPQARAAASSSLTGYRTGRTGLLALLDLQNTVLGYETAYYRAQSDFAKKMAELEELVGAEVLP